MPAKKKDEKRKYEKDEPVSLRPLDLPAALAALLKVKPKDGHFRGQSEKPPQSSNGSDDD